jgi:hypothetical protein
MEIWRRFFAYENGAVHLDVNDGDRTNLQLVITGEILHSLYHAKMIYLEYDQKEFLLRGYHSELRQKTPTATYPEMLRGVFYPWDFDKLFSENTMGGNGTVYEIERINADLVLKKGYRQSGSSRSHGPYHQTYYFDREYVLHGGRELTI